MGARGAERGGGHTIDSYNDDKFDPSVPSDEPETDQPPPSDQDRQRVGVGRV